jgi:hypothetical protein
MFDIFIWLGIAFCVSQSAMFSGLNLAFFSINKLQLKIESSHGNEAAKTVLSISSFQIDAKHAEDDVIDNDIILIWGNERRIITGADILGRLLRGITNK